MTTELIAKWRPTLVIPKGDRSLPVSVDRFLEFMGLYRLTDESVESLIAAGQIDLSRPEVRSAFRSFSHNDNDSIFLSANVLDKRTDGDTSTVDSQWLEEIRDEVGAAFPTYVLWHDRASKALPEQIKLPEDLKATLEDHSLVTYYFYFPVQDGFGFGTYVNSSEGHWVGVSLLIDPESGEPLLAGFHGIRGVRILPWEDVRLDDEGHPLAFVALGTRSLFEAPDDYDFETRLFELGLDDSDGHSATIEGGGGSGRPAQGGAGWLLLLIALGLISTGAVLACLALLESCWNWLKRTLCGDDDDDPAPTPSDLDDTQGQRRAVQLPTSEAPSGANPWAEPSDGLQEPTVRGSESVPQDGIEVRPSQIVEAWTRLWWPALMSWGDLDIRQPGLMRFSPGRPRPSLDRDFLLAALDRLD